MQDEKFLNLFRSLQSEVHRTAVTSGWHDKTIEDGTMIALIHSELSEALEALRKGVEKSNKIPTFTEVEEELADAIIRAMDYSESRGYDLAGAIVAKKEYNKCRSYKHGGKKF